MKTEKIFAALVVIFAIGTGCENPEVQSLVASCPLEEMVLNGQFQGASGRTSYVCREDASATIGVFYALYEDGTAYYHELPKDPFDPYISSTWELDSEECSITVYEGSVAKLKIQNAALTGESRLESFESVRVSDEQSYLLNYCYYDLSPGV